MRREISDLPVLQPAGDEDGRWHGRKGVKEVRWQTAGGWAVADCYVDGTYRGRYVIDENGRHGRLDGRKRVRRSLKTILEDPYMDWHMGQVIRQAGEAKEAATFLGMPEGRGWQDPLQWILNLEEGEGRERREKVWRRKKDRIDDLMALVPSAPDGLDDFVMRKVFPYDYLFPADPGADEDPEWVRGKTFHCTACGNIHRYDRPPKLGMPAACRQTGRTVIRKRKGAAVREQEAVLVFQEIDRGRSVMRFFRAARKGSEDFRDFIIAEEARIIMNRNESAEKDRVYYGQNRWLDEWDQEWGTGNVWNIKIGRCWCYPEGIGEALAGTAYEKAPVGKIAACGWKLDYNQVVLSAAGTKSGGNIAAVLEYMTAMGMHRMVAETAGIYLHWGHYSGPLHQKADSAAGIFGIDMQRVRRLAALDGGSVILDWLRYEKDAGIRIRDEVLRWMQEKGLTRHALGFILDRMSPEQVKNYIVREGACHSVLRTIETWKDYLSMSARLGLDVQDAIVYRTKNLYMRHDEAVEEFARRKEEIEAAEYEEKYGGITRACARIRDKFDYVGEEFRIVTPRGAKDIIEDSRQLHHCAGASDRYYDRIEQDETYILFLRRNSEPDKAYYTLEVEPDGTTRQKRSAFNRQPDLPVINAFLKEWQAVVRSRLSRADREAAQVSARKREEEMAQLAASNRQRDADLYEALTADLLPAGEDAMCTAI